MCELHYTAASCTAVCMVNNLLTPRIYSQPLPYGASSRRTVYAFIVCSSLVTTAGRVLCLDALAIAIDTTVDEEGRWFASTNTLETVCLDLCVACRSSWKVPTKRVVVDARTPRRLWLRGQSSGSGSMREPPLPVRAVKVVQWPDNVLKSLSEGQRRLATRSAGRSVEDDSLWWPGTVIQQLTLNTLVSKKNGAYQH